MCGESWHSTLAKLERGERNSHPHHKQCNTPASQTHNTKNDQLPDTWMSSLENWGSWLKEIFWLAATYSVRVYTTQNVTHKMIY